ncbi:D-alanyl-D-alanine carboxypeptidase [Exiguobacterium sp. SL-10]|uniref:D-alanyl-D-alanine carboxypeptidase family protein n=1 Tax=Exiguobacterium sp. SL-10 TaxID=2510962 RepID=UPI00103CB358|nr:serine hydrolase [Exiguobacterium sp. SL-10]TCI30718.1 D-alanyl-D-alanine carboxypeptidase [Exiguobacterium sp. SL-10]
MRRLTVGLALVGLLAIIPALIGFKQEPEPKAAPAVSAVVPVKQGPTFPEIPIMDWTNQPIAASDTAELLVGSMAFVNLTDGEILLDKNASERVFPASTTKLMTALLAYEAAVDKNELDQDVVIVKQSTLDIPWDSHIVHLAVGDRLTVRQALYATLLESGNDAANSLAEYVSGSTTEFVDLMNARSKVLGLTGTQFRNAHGYSDPEHFTTALDMAKIAYAFGTYPELLEIAGTYEYEAKFVDQNGDLKRRWWYHLGSAVNERSIHYSELVKATKTGYTDESGYTMVFLMERDGKQYVLVTMQAKSGQTFPTMRSVEQIAFGITHE